MSFSSHLAEPTMIQKIKITKMTKNDSQEYVVVSKILQYNSFDFMRF